jgi:hypothetical protein
MAVVGPFHDEVELMDALRQLSRRSGVRSGEITEHVYRTHIFEEGMGRRYLATTQPTAILATAEVDNK